MGKDEKGSIPLAIFSCQSGASAHQYYSLTKNDQLRREDTCAVSSGREPETLTVILSQCDYIDKSQKWTHEKVMRSFLSEDLFVSKLFMFRMERLFIIQVNSALIWEGLSNNDQVKLKTCDPHKSSQQWLFGRYPIS